jgi:C1A family cysteine protease
VARIINNNGEGRTRVLGARLRSWRPELPDHRDFKFAASGIAIRDRVASLGVARKVRVHDQGVTSSCTGHAGTSALETSFGLTGDANQMSRLFPYYQARVMIGEAHLDMGAYNRDVMKSIANDGVPNESKWKFATANVIKVPSKTAYADAKVRHDTQFAGVQYQRCANLDAIIAAINDGCAVMFGFVCYDNVFDLNAKDFVLKMPEPTWQSVGGHAVCADGYSVPDRVIEVQGSWGTTYANKGHFRMPFEWFTSPDRLVDDVWAVVPPRKIAVV